MGDRMKEQIGVIGMIKYAMLDVIAGWKSAVGVRESRSICLKERESRKLKVRTWQCGACVRLMIRGECMPVRGHVMEITLSRLNMYVVKLSLRCMW